MKKIDEVVLDLVMQHEGGQRFFDALDATIREDVGIFRSLTGSIDKDIHSYMPIIVSGKFGRVFANYFGLDSIIVVNGGLRAGESVDDLSYLNIKPGTEYIFIDDSFYSGKTRDRIQAELARHGAKIAATYVVYDGSKTKDKTVHSLYRFYGE